MFNQMFVKGFNAIRGEASRLFNFIAWSVYWNNAHANTPMSVLIINYQRT